MIVDVGLQCHQSDQPVRRAPLDPADIPKVYSPAEVEKRLYGTWERKNYFRAEVDSGKEPFTIVIPPPNITGALHIGHALDHTLQDVLIRFKRMQGFAALWLPGTDHAGIATQNVVEKDLRKQGLSRHDLGRERFVERVWEWKDVYGNQIFKQDRRLGASLDWTRERFTMDPGLSKAVRKVFVDLYNEGLIYRGNRIINWCPRCGTALSDIEVDHSDHEGQLEQFRYEFEDGSESPQPSVKGVSVATTRLETMLGDTAVAVNPKDPRFADAVGKFAIHPFSGRRIEIIADDAVDMEFGTGAVKMTPAHDPTDFEVAERHGLEKLSIMDGQARINAAGAPFEGMDRYEARDAVRKALQDKGLYEGSTPHNYAIGKCSRCGTIVEPWLSEQWFVKMRPLAAPAIAAVKEGRTKFYPARWTNYYLNWMENIRDWCISRQLWWGHRIPVWYCDNGHQWAALEDPAACPECSSKQIHQDPDVLDTWFSSQLWPFSTLGWPEQTPDLGYFYPTSVLVTGYEIIHLWVARMMMSGLKFMGDVPFKWVYIHGIVRDAQGRKMSKSLGNVIDPLELIDKYGTDALRFSLVEHATGQDIFLNTEWVSGSRNFVNKLWNAARFVLTNAGDDTVGGLSDASRLDLSDRWILSRLASTIDEVTRQLESFETAAAARNVYDFIWSEFCDWYIEAAKVRLYSEDSEISGTVRTVLVNVLERALRLAHPFIPFVTEEIWQLLPIRHEKPSIVISEWPKVSKHLLNEGAVASFDRVKLVVSAIRSFRSEYGISPKARLMPTATSDDPAERDALMRDRALISRLAGLEDLDLQDSLAETKGARLIAGNVEISIPLEGLVDLGAEAERLRRQIEKTEMEIEKVESKLGNSGFVSRAPEAVVAEQRRRLEEERATLAKLGAQLRLLGVR